VRTSSQARCPSAAVLTRNPSYATDSARIVHIDSLSSTTRILSLASMPTLLTKLSRSSAGKSNVCAVPLKRHRPFGESPKRPVVQGIYAPLK
jgi:hypothetical protein